MQRIHLCDFLNALGLNFVAEKGKKEDSQIALGLVHTSDGIGSTRSVTIQCKSKSGIGSGVGSSKESESEGSVEFLFLLILLLLLSCRFTLDQIFLPIRTPLMTPLQSFQSLV